MMGIQSMGERGFNKTILIIIGCIMLPHNVVSQSLWKDSVEFIKFDNYGYDRIIFYPDCTFLQLYYCNARMDIAEYSKGKYWYDKGSKSIVTKSGPNYMWNISVDTSFSGNDSLMLSLKAEDREGLVLLVNEDTVDISELNCKNRNLNNQSDNMTNGGVDNSFYFIYKKESDIIIIDKLSEDTVFNFHGGAVIVNITLERDFILFADKYIQFEEKKFIVDEDFNLRNDNGELTYYFFDKTGLNRLPLKHVFNHLKD